jgi:hypothetical protein
VTSEEQEGWFGVNTHADLITVTNPTEGAPSDLPCSLGTAASCYVVSVLKHLNYAPWLDAGFSLRPYPLEACNVFAAGNCSAVPMLTVGLTEEIESKFSLVTLTCPQPNYLGPSLIDGYPVCEDHIPFSTVEITLPNSSTITLAENLLFDSGNPAVDLVQSAGTLPSPLPEGSAVSIVTPSGFTYSYTAASSGITETSVATSGSAGAGVNFFTKNSFLIDFSTGTEGWMNSM